MRRSTITRRQAKVGAASHRTTLDMTELTPGQDATPSPATPIVAAPIGANPTSGPGVFPVGRAT